MFNDTLTWDTLEHHHGEKSSDWYWIIGVIALSLAVLCIIFGNVLLGIFILLGAITAGIHAAHPPKLIHVELNPRGILVEKTLYRYDHLDSFWIEEHKDPHNIILQSKKFLMPYIIVPINPHIHIDDVRAYLLLHLKEVEHHESLAHEFMEYLGF
jgi:hypothetical protein